MSTRRPSNTPSTASSLRLPSALRGAPGSRGRAAKAHVSLIFAQGDPLGPRAGDGASASEEALARQLDRESAGERMSLRSRRSSAATLASVRDYPSTLAERAEPPIEEPVAGPSRLLESHTLEAYSAIAPPPPALATPDSGLDSMREGRLRPVLSKRQSAVWLRWTSPSPSFPKKDAKGKEREGEPEVESDRVEQSETPHTASQLPVADPSVPTTAPDPEAEDAKSVSALLPPQPEPPEPATPRSPRPPEPTTPRPASVQSSLEPKLHVNVTAPTPNRGWRAYLWGGTPTATSAPEPNGDENTLAKVDSRASALTNGTVATNATADTVETGRTDTTGATNGSAMSDPKRRRIEAPSVRSASSRPPSIAPAMTPLTSNRVSVEVPSARTSTDVLPAREDDTQADGTAETSADEPMEEDASETAVAPVVQPEGDGWGAYLWSWVVPPPLPPAPARGQVTTEPEVQEDPSVEESAEASTAVQPTSPVAEQPPAPEERPPEVDPTPGPTPDASAIQLASQPKQLATSSASTAGWLSYLAFRASQKKITGSTITPEDGRRSGETHREEVMDFENDPSFPAAETSKGGLKEPAGEVTKAESVKGKAGSIRGKAESIKGSKADSVKGVKLEKKADSIRKEAIRKDSAKCDDAVKTDGKETPKEQASAVPQSLRPSASNQRLTHKRSQNLAISDRRLSDNSSVKSGSAPPSPRVASGHQPSKSTSALPAPPKAQQQSFIVPTFETTFDRPPRSLPPRREEAGVGATTLRALGALSSYVYGESKPQSAEKRGQREGRDVGANLPRRVGLGGGDANEGWKSCKRVVVVGVHGWFPAKMITSVIGEPTGTSTKFANMMGEAVRKFFAENGISENDIRLTQIPLEGEGTIEHRVDKLYKQYLSNPAWINDLRRADAILFAAHSQGCIVTTHLISRMIAQGHIRTPLNKEAVARCEWAFGPIGIIPDESSKKGRRLAASLTGAEGGKQKVGMLAMCGVHLGPLYSINSSSVIHPYLQWFENAAARELFEFQDTTSAVSTAYQKALAMILENEVRVLLLSSLNDQVVPIYGASFSTATHPLLLRALYVDGASYSQSDFMTNLLAFAFMLRNAGIDDQRLVEHLSEATAGSLTGVGHSTPYEALGCYSLAVHYLFHAGPAAHPLPPLHVEPFAARDGRNDFELPWIMRALVDAPEVKDLFPDELKDLKESIIAWRPQTKPLKEIKKRLEPMAGRQSALRQVETIQETPSSASLNSMAHTEPKKARQPKVTPSRL